MPKISELPPSTIPLSGAELVAVVQSGETKSAAVSAIFNPTITPVCDNALFVFDTTYAINNEHPSKENTDWPYTLHAKVDVVKNVTDFLVWHVSFASTYPMPRIDINGDQLMVTVLDGTIVNGVLSIFARLYDKSTGSVLATSNTITLEILEPAGS